MLHAVPHLTAVDAGADPYRLASRGEEIPVSPAAE